MKFAQMLKNRGLTAGSVFVTGLMKGHEAARMVADCKAQETIRAMNDRIIADAEAGGVSHLVERLATFYHSEHVAICQPWILATPFEEWRDKQLAARGITL
ncbi:hypothetical protein [Paenibacillus sp. NRS-1760]|uniref:hypothetical protein n=1 Tax=Paenibacillus sp. NRS-1760 TaxID=3233902 RepID=UPI003D2BE30C